LIRDIDGRSELILSFPFRVCAFDPATGQERWTSTGINSLVYTSPIFARASSWPWRLWRHDGGPEGGRQRRRDAGEPALAHPRTKQRIGSGAIHNGLIFIHNDPGIAECFDLPTGKLVWEQRLRGESSRGTNWSSVMIADACATR